MTVFPVRIIMSPTCSSRFLVGRNARSAAALTICSYTLPSKLNLDSFLNPCQDRWRDGTRRAGPGPPARGPPPAPEGAHGGRDPRRLRAPLPRARLRGREDRRDRGGRRRGGRLDLQPLREQGGAVRRAARARARDLRDLHGGG